MRGEKEVTRGTRRRNCRVVRIEERTSVRSVRSQSVSREILRGAMRVREGIESGGPGRGREDGRGKKEEELVMGAGAAGRRNEGGTRVAGRILGTRRCLTGWMR